LLHAARQCPAARAAVWDYLDERGALDERAAECLSRLATAGNAARRRCLSALKGYIGYLLSRYIKGGGG
jgi:hypothetical protein